MVVKRSRESARDKVEEEGRCRACLAPDGEVDDGDVIRIQAAHTIGREHDEVRVGSKGGETLFVRRESVVPLCQFCHIQYDARRLDLLPYLFLPEQLDAVRAAGGIERAHRRLTGERGV
jgi:hypothetical protein